MLALLVCLRAWSRAKPVPPTDHRFCVAPYSAEAIGVTAVFSSISGVIRYPDESILAALDVPARPREPVEGCPSSALSFCASPSDADLMNVIFDPEFLRRSALSLSPRDREHAERDDEIFGPSCARDLARELYSC